MIADTRRCGPQSAPRVAGIWTPGSSMRILVKFSLWARLDEFAAVPSKEVWI